MEVRLFLKCQAKEFAPFSEATKGGKMLETLLEE
jgi:hypothetical protein